MQKGQSFGLFAHSLSFECTICQLYHKNGLFCPFKVMNFQFSVHRHASEIAAMALDLLAGSVVFQIPHKPNSRLQMRMGIHSGPAVGVVAGSKIPKYLWAASPHYDLHFLQSNIFDAFQTNSRSFLFCQLFIISLYDMGCFLRRNLWFSAFVSS